MRFGIQSVGTLFGRSSRINAATGTFDVGRRTDELLTFRRLAHGEQRRSVRQPASSAPEEPGCARWLRCRNELTAGPVFCDRTGKRLRAITESQATVDVATTAITNRKTSAGGSGDYTTPPPMNASAERKIARPTQADLRGLGTTDYTAPCCSKTHQGQTCAVLLYGKHNKTSTKKIPQVNKIQSTVKAHYKTVIIKQTTHATGATVGFNHFATYFNNSDDPATEWMGDEDWISVCSSASDVSSDDEMMSLVKKRSTYKVVMMCKVSTSFYDLGSGDGYLFTQEYKTRHLVKRLSLNYKPISNPLGHRIVGIVEITKWLKPTAEAALVDEKESMGMHPNWRIALWAWAFSQGGGYW
ncbi:Uncharacterized protein FWK35_00005532 [Aphis craccivora]|uniref:Uncharacterized protein n=1 Tax=Aphis craccivora TaxID=307492 RepID=A0A6G0ZEU3_APHCR|nr:Uncharacterized protein FWK35_00005532 [Aphis craccivora]